MAYKFVNADQLDAALTTVADAIRTKGGTTEPLSFPTGMENAIEAISTGVELNFEVVGGTTRPSDPKENTIWVNTSTNITGWIFSATEPINTTPGVVWFAVGSSSDTEFNALKENGIQVYPTSAKQYVDGAFVSIDAHCYQNGEWNQFSMSWDGTLYNAGDQYTGITGGWKAASGVGQKATFNSTNITVSTTGTHDDFETALYTKNKIDTTGFTKLTAVLTNIVNPSSYNAWGVYVGLTSQNTDSCPTGSMVASAKHSSTGSKTLTVDISKKQGLYYPVVLGDVATFVVTKIYLS